jgi:hypothetical protein
VHPKLRTVPSSPENNNDYHDVYSEHYAEIENDVQKKLAMTSNNIYRPDG